MNRMMEQIIYTDYFFPSYSWFLLQQWGSYAYLRCREDMMKISSIIDQPELVIQRNCIILLCQLRQLAQYLYIRKTMLQNIGKPLSFFYDTTLNMKQKACTNKEARNFNHLGNNLESCCLLSVNSITGIGLESALYFVETAIQKCVQDQNSNNNFQFNMEQYYIDQNGSLVFLPNRIIGKKSVDVQDEQIVVATIIKQISKICYVNCFDDFCKYFQRVSISSKCDFKFALSMIQVYRQCGKIKISDRIEYFQQGEYKSNRRNICELISSQRLSQISEISKSLKKSMRLSKATSANTINSNPFIRQITVKSIGNSSQIMESVENGEKIQKIKQSSVSTAFKSSINQDSISGSTMNLGNRLGGSILIDPYKIQVNRSLFPMSLQQIDSQSEETDKQQSSNLSVKKESQTESIIIERENEQRILNMNNWEKKVSKLVKQSNMKQSYTIETEAEKYLNNKISLESALLGKMARVVVKSLLPASQ